MYTGPDRLQRLVPFAITTAAVPKRSAVCFCLYGGVGTITIDDFSCGAVSDLLHGQCVHVFCSTQLNPPCAANCQALGDLSAVNDGYCSFGAMWQTSVLSKRVLISENTTVASNVGQFLQ